MNIRRTIAASVLLVSTCIAPAASARDRPGTPTDVFAGVFDTSPGNPPRVLLSFRNTATELERVSFYLEWTENGAPMSGENLGGRLDCPTGTAQQYYCHPTTFYRHPRVQGRALTNHREFPHAVLFKNLKFDSEYCFRLIARDVDQVFSEIWSAWACTRTASPPPAPQPPEKVQLTFVPGSSGRGSAGAAAPPRALIEWLAPLQTNFIAVFEIEQWVPHTQRWQSDDIERRGRVRVGGGVNPGEREVTIDLRAEVDQQAPPRFRVCSVNVAGRACVNAVAARLLDTAIATQPIGGARRAAEPIAAPPEIDSPPTQVRSADVGRGGVDLQHAPIEASASAARDTPALQPSATSAVSSGAQAGQPVVASGELRATQLQGAADLGGASLQQELRLLCRGGAPYPSGRYGQVPEKPDREWHILFLARSATPAREDGSGLEPGRCAFTGRVAEEALTHLRLEVGVGDGTLANLATYLAEASAYWSFELRRDPNGTYEAVEHGAWASPRAGQAGAAAIAAKPSVASPALAPRAPATIDASGLGTVRMADRPAPATPVQQSSIGGTTVAGTGRTAPTAPIGNTPLQRSPLGSPAGAIADRAALDIETEELRCRGGAGLRFESRGLTADGRSALVALYFTTPKTNAAGQRPSAGPNGEWLEPGTCTFADRVFAIEDPPGVQFETALPDDEREVREARSGERRSAAQSPDARSIPEYLRDANQYWSFSVYKTSYGYYQAVRHGAWTPAVAPPPELNEWRTDAFGGPGGARFQDSCEIGWYLAGAAVRIGDDVDAVALICGRVRPDGSRAETRVGRFAGGGGGELVERLCPAQEPFVRALRVIWGGEDTWLVKDLQLRCGPLRGPLPTAVPTFNVLSYVGLSGDDVRDSPLLECPGVFAYVGFHGRAGAMVDRLGGICRQVPLTQ